MSNRSYEICDTELKNYSIKADSWDEFLEAWRKLLPIRKKFGFEVLFALVDREKNLFTWAVQHPGDFDAADRDYQNDPERVALDFIGKYVTGAEMAKVSREKMF